MIKVDQKLWDFFIGTVLNYTGNIIISSFGRTKVSIGLINSSVPAGVIFIKEKKLPR